MEAFNKMINVCTRYATCKGKLKTFRSENNFTLPHLVIGQKMLETSVASFDLRCWLLMKLSFKNDCLLLMTSTQGIFTALLWLFHGKNAGSGVMLTKKLYKTNKLENRGR